MRHVPRWIPVLLLAGLGVALSAPGCGPREASPTPSDDATSPWTLEALSPAMLARVKEDVGKDTGVLVLRVAPDGEAARADVRAGDVLLRVAGTLSTDPRVMERARAGASGDVPLVVYRRDAAGEASILEILLPAPSPATAAPPPPETVPVPVPVPAAPTPTERLDTSVSGCVDAYFAMLDFCRKEAWGRPSTTSSETRRRATALLEESLPAMDAATRAAVAAIPATWADLERRWRQATQTERARQRTTWRDQLVLPNPLLPAPPDLQTFRSDGDTLVFRYPASWVADRTRDEDTDFLFFGPPGTETTWAQVVDPARSPPGVFLAVSPLDPDLRAVASPEAGARLIARRFVTSRAPDLREVTTFHAGGAGFVILRGRLPGQDTETFAWVAVAPFDGDHFLAARFAGPLDQAEDLLPVFSTFLASMQITTAPTGGGGGGGSAAVDLAAATIGNAVVNAGWSD